MNLILLILSIEIGHQAFAQVYCENIKKWEFICLNCSTMAICVNSGNEWKTIEVGKCDENEKLFCNRNTRNCSETKACGDLLKKEFECNTEGLFPDPYDCKSYYACVIDSENKLAPNKSKCADNTAFSPATNECSINDDDEICLKQQFECKQPGDMKMWPGNNNIYYICNQETEYDEKFLYPMLFRCNLGEVFVEIEPIGQCISNDESTKVEPNDPTTVRSICTQQGLFPNPTDCRSYYICNSQMQRTIARCPSDRTYFDSKAKKCVFGTCEQENTE